MIPPVFPPSWRLPITQKPAPNKWQGQTQPAQYDTTKPRPLKQAFHAQLTWQLTCHPPPQVGRSPERGPTMPRRRANREQSPREGYKQHRTVRERCANNFYTCAPRQSKPDDPHPTQETNSADKSAKPTRGRASKRAGPPQTPERNHPAAYKRPERRPWAPPSQYPKT